MFGLFFTDAASVDDFEAVGQCNMDYFNRFFHAMLDQGVYLAPSAYEAGFVSSAHSEAIIDEALVVVERVFAALLQQLRGSI